MSVRRTILAVVALGAGLGLAGCTDFDMPEWFGSKKPLPGERRAVFPEGVPGITQGVPPEYRKGAQQSPDAQAVAEPEVKPEPPKPKPRPPRAATPRPIQQPAQAQPAQPAQARPAPQAQQSGSAPWPAPQQQQAAPWPSQSPQTAQPAQPAWPTPGNTTAR
jgi:hypothetical protein